jgi:hypothetical protein
MVSAAIVGICHADVPARDSLARELVEAVRADVDT